MSIHPSLASSGKDKKQKTVLKRIERIKHLMEKGLWKDSSCVFGLPKIKMVRIKIKKEKAAKEATPAAGAEVTLATEAQSPTPTAQPAAQATKPQVKPAPSKK